MILKSHNFFYIIEWFLCWNTEDAKILTKEREREKGGERWRTENGPEITV
jgi:hypothetical protein